MSKDDPTKPPLDPSKPPVEAKKPMTAAEAAKLVKRPVPVLDQAGKPTGRTEERSVSEKEVFDFKDHGDVVVVVTVDGQKFVGAKK